MSNCGNCVHIHIQAQIVRDTGKGRERKERDRERDAPTIDKYIYTERDKQTLAKMPLPNFIDLLAVEHVLSIGKHHNIG